MIYYASEEEGYWFANSDTGEALDNIKLYIARNNALPLAFVREGIQSDFYIIDATIPAFTNSGLKVAKDVLQDFGQFRTFNCEGVDLHLFFCDNLLDVLDKKKSEYEEENGHIYWFERMIFREDKLAGEIVFKIPETNDTFFCDKAVELLGKIQGIKFIAAAM